MAQTKDVTEGVAAKEAPSRPMVEITIDPLPPEVLVEMARQARCQIAPGSPWDHRLRHIAYSYQQQKRSLNQPARRKRIAKLSKALDKSLAAIDALEAGDMLSSANGQRSLQSWESRSSKRPKGVPSDIAARC
jgi:hypothetical protein